MNTVVEGIKGDIDEVIDNTINNPMKELGLNSYFRETNGKLNIYTKLTIGFVSGYIGYRLYKKMNLLEKLKNQSKEMARAAKEKVVLLEPEKRTEIIEEVKDLFDW